MDAHKNMEHLLQKYLSGTCTPDERLQVEHWYRQLDLQGGLPSREQMEIDLAEVRNRLPIHKERRPAFWYIAAATVAAMLAVGVYMYRTSSERPGTDMGMAAISLPDRSEEHTSELQSREKHVCR